MKKVFIGLTSVLLFSQTGCEIEDYNLSDISTDDLVLTTSISSPIGQSSISIEDLLKKQNIEGLGYDENGLVVFAYDTLQHFAVESIQTKGFNSIRNLNGYYLFEKQIDKKGVSKEEFENLSTPLNLSLPKGEKIPVKGKIAIKDIFDDEKYRIDSIIFKQAPVVVNLKTDIKGLLENSTANFGINANDNETGFKPKADHPFTINLNNTTIKLGKTDSIEIDGYLTLTSALTIPISPKNKLAILLTAADNSWHFDKAWGIFNGIDTQFGFERIPIDLYEKNDEEGVKFNLIAENPNITLNAKTNIGIPFALGIGRLEATNGKKTISAEFEDGGNTYIKELDYAKTPGDNITALDVTFDKKNGNIDKLVNMLPNEVAIDYVFSPLETDLNSEQNHFITSDAYIDMLCRVELPAYLRKGSYILVSDTLKDIEIGDDLGEKYSFERLKLTAIAKNSLPFNAKVQFYFLQENEETGAISIIPDININKDITVAAGKVNSKNDMVMASTTSIQLLEFKEKDIPSLKKAKHLLIMYEVAVNEFNKVKVTRDNKLNVVLKGFAKGSVNIGNLEDKEDENN